MIDTVIQKISEGGQLTFAQAYDLVTQADLHQLCEGADRLRKHFHGDHFDLCSIINARSGGCSEDCRFCAQSARYQADIEVFEVASEEEAVRQAEENDNGGVKRLSLVTAGRSVDDDLLATLGQLYGQIEQRTSLSLCASMGFLTREKAQRLISFHVTRYHCNLETCEDYFDQICTTHDYRQKVETIQIARDAGMEICSGGIIGMGETLSHRLQLAFELRDLEVRSIPINILTPIANTPFSGIDPLGTDDILRCIAIFRYINPDATIRLAGGRNLLGARQCECFESGANGAIVGNYLTTSGNELNDDLRMIAELGFVFK